MCTMGQVNVRERIARRAEKEIEDGNYVNLRDWHANSSCELYFA